MKADVDQIVGRALASSSKRIGASPVARSARYDYLTLEHFLPLQHERELFQRHVHAEVRSAGFDIDLAVIPIEPQITIQHVAHSVAVALSSLSEQSATSKERFPVEPAATETQLPGKPTTNDPGENGGGQSGQND
jgi:hypothetical protein